MFGHLTGWELLIILFVAIILFGKRLPELGRSLGRGIIEFKKGFSGEDDDESIGAHKAPL